MGAGLSFVRINYTASMPGWPMMLGLWFAAMAVAAVLLVVTFLRVRRSDSVGAGHAVLFEEKWTSGRSHRSFVSQLGGAKRCLHVTVTDKALVLRFHFPFRAVDFVSGLQATIQHDAIVEVKGVGAAMMVFYRDPANELCRVELRLRDSDRFWLAMQQVKRPMGNEPVSNEQIGSAGD
jgi:hypothetical protein